MLVAESLRKTFGGLTAVDDVSLSLDRHDDEKVFLLGPNGAGKTTLIDLLTGFFLPDEGRVTLDGEDITGVSPSNRIDQGLVRSFQVVTLFNSMNVRQNIRFTIQVREGVSHRPLTRYDSLRQASRETEKSTAV